jgi:putative ABC transport system permease protein
MRQLLRSFWRTPLFPVLHIAGLAIGLSAAWLVWQYADFELSHNRQIPNGGRIFRVISHFSGPDFNSSNAGCPAPLWTAAAELPGVKHAIPLQQFSALMVTPEGTTKPFSDQKNVYRTTPDYFGLIPYKWLAGSPAMALSQPAQVVLTRLTGEKYFPRHQPEEMIGKVIRYQGFQDTIMATVTGIVEALDYPSSFQAEELLTAPQPKPDRWGSVNSSDQVWLVLDEKANAAVVEKAVNDLSSEKSAEDLKKWGMSRRHELQPLANVHFDVRVGSHIRVANKTVLSVLSAVALFLLLLACINYINLSTARIPARAREIGVRKTLGGSKSGIIIGFLKETVLLCLFAMGFAGLLTFAAFSYFKENLPNDVLKFIDWRKTALFLVGLLALVSLISGLYPGWLASRFQASALLRGQFTGQHAAQQRRGRGLRSGLIVFQFFIAQVFIIGALVVGQQIHFMRHSDLGFDKEAVLTLEQPLMAYRDPALKDKLPLLAEAFGKLPEVQQVALGDPLLNQSFSSNTHEYINAAGQKKEINLYRKHADANLTDLYRLPLLAGRKLTIADSSRAYLINETAVRRLGFESPQAAVGQFLSEQAGDDKKKWEIIGVVSDFHSAGFTEEIHPMSLLFETENLNVVNVRLASTRPADWQQALQKMEAAWQKIYPNETFEAKFYDETLADIYASDLSLARFINLATSIAIFISCLGLFGLVTFMAWRRTKEIGIRKVLGATTASVVSMLSREFLVLVLISFVLAAPVAFYFLRNWLNNYAYRIELAWWMFALTGLGAVVVAALTVGFQSLRAAQTNPVKSLRND